MFYGGMVAMGFAMFAKDTASQITLNLLGQFVASKIVIWTMYITITLPHSFISISFILYHQLVFIILLRMCVMGMQCGHSLQVVNPFTKYGLTITLVAHSLEEMLPQRLDFAKYHS
jgi:hypothetical protein